MGKKVIAFGVIIIAVLGIYYFILNGGGTKEEVFQDLNSYLFIKLN